MTRRRSMTVLLLTAAWLGGVVGASAPAAGDGDFKVIVHPRNPVRVIDREFLRDVFLKKATDWRGGPAARPIDLPRAATPRDRFGERVLKKSRAQLRSYWNQQIFSGKGVPPPEAESIAGAIAFVLANPGAVSYLPADADPGGAKVVVISD
jgi:ABC-type phosphate transport system substrate-binding protein